jgi:hypothetical protein
MALRYTGGSTKAQRSIIRAHFCLRVKNLCLDAELERNGQHQKLRRSSPWCRLAYTSASALTLSLSRYSRPKCAASVNGLCGGKRYQRKDRRAMNTDCTFGCFRRMFDEDVVDSTMGVNFLFLPRIPANKHRSSFSDISTSKRAFKSTSFSSYGVPHFSSPFS